VNAEGRESTLGYKVRMRGDKETLTPTLSLKRAREQKRKRL